MQVSAKLKNFKMSAKKMRLAADLVRGKKTEEAVSQLKFLAGSKAALPLIKLINSSVANGMENLGLNKSNLYIQEIKVDEGSVMKRWRPRAHGRAYPIMKRSCHIEVILNEVKEGEGRVKVEKKVAKTVSYQELKKMTEEADKILEKAKQKKGRKKEDKAEQKKVGSDKEGKGGSLSRIFRRKSI